jgi:cardiolipin synthase
VRVRLTRRWPTLLAAVAAIALAHAAVTSAGTPGIAAVASATTDGPLTVLAEPQAGRAPILELIGSARHSIALTMYEFSDPQLEQALIAAAHRGVEVRVLLNGGYYSEHESTNDAALHELAAHGVHVRDTPTYFALTHQKTLTVDGRVSAILTLNFDGLYASTRDYAVIDRQPADVAAITRAFDGDWAGRRTAAQDGTGDLVWSPGDAAGDAIVSMIDAARHSVELESEEMNYDPATDALCAAARRGVAVHIVMTYESDWRDAFAQLEKCGVRVHLYHGQSYYIHAKLLVVDGRSALVSSQNLSTGSLRDNRELGIRLTAPPLLHALIADFDADYAGASEDSGG